MNISLKKLAIYLFLPFFLVACINGTMLFSHYSAALNPARELANKGEYQAALNAMPNAPFGELLDNMERGRLAFLADDMSQTETAWRAVDSLLQAQNSKAQLQISKGVNQASALLVNDNMIAYSLSDYELGFFHLYQALFFLRQSNLSAALVEVRRANQVQEAALRARKEALKKAQEVVENNQLLQDSNLGAVLAKYPAASNELATVQNAYLFYLSALLYEAEKNFNSAFIDYSRALSVASENQYIANALMRVAKRQGRVNEVNLLQKKYGQLRLNKKNQGQLVIIIEKGLVNPRSGWQIPFIYRNVNYGAFANLHFVLPFYRNLPNDFPHQIEPSINEKKINLFMLTDVNRMAEKNLAENMPAIVTRQILRLIAKTQLIKVASEKDDSRIGQFATGLFSIMSEQPDTRSWQMLPAKIELFSQYYDEGKVILGMGKERYPIEIKTNKTSLFWLSVQGNRFTHWQGILGEI